MSSTSGSLALPSQSIGRLIGVGGRNIKELERLSGCRVSIGQRRDKSGEPCEGEPSQTTEVRASCGGARAADREARAGICLRAAELLCTAGRSVDDAWRMAQQESADRLSKENEAWEAEQVEMMVRRVLIAWPEFDEAYARDALLRNDLDEDRAIEALLSGSPQARTPPRAQGEAVPQGGHPVLRAARAREEKPKEDFPSLGVDAPCGGMGGRHAAWMHRRPAAMVQDSPEIASDAVFPALPAPLPCGPRRTCPAREAQRRAALRHQIRSSFVARSRQ